MIHLLLWQALSHAAVFEQSPLGGIWGSPAIRSSHAAWWNPAMLPVNRTSFLAGAGYQFGQIQLSTAQEKKRYKGAGPSAHLGAVTQISRIRLGLSSGIPYALSGQSQQDPDYFLSSARIAIASHSLALATTLQNWDIGAGLNFYQAQWQSSLRTDGLYDYAQSIRATGLQPSYTDAMLMQEAYAIDIDIDGRANALGYAFGVAYTHKAWRFGLSGNIAPIMDVAGTARLSFSCPPEDDPMARENASDLGLCNETYTGQARHSLPLPHRFQLALHHDLANENRWWLAAGTVRWERYQDFELILSGFTADPEAQAFIEKPRPWARDLQASYWLQSGYDHQGKRLMSHYRLGLDGPSVPKESLSPNNSDALTVRSAGAISHTRTMPNRSKWTIGMAASMSYRLPRQNNASLFSLSVDNPVLESRYRWPDGSGVYTGYVAGIEAYLRFISSPL